MSLSGDLPDWTVETAPLIQNASATNQGAGGIIQLLQSANPYRIWAVWVDVSISSSSTFAGGPSTWGAQVGDGSGAALLRAQCHCATSNQNNAHGLVMPLSGYTPIKSGGLYTTNLVTDAGITNLFTRANGGILYSIP